MPATESNHATAWARKLAPVASPGDDIFTEHFATVDDDKLTRKTSPQARLSFEGG